MNGHTVSSVVIFLCQIIDLNYDVCGDLEMKIPPKQILVILPIYFGGFIYLFMPFTIPSAIFFNALLEWSLFLSPTSKSTDAIVEYDV